MNLNVTIWGRDFSLPVSYQNFPGEEVTSIQNETVANASRAEFNSSLESVKQYIKKWNSMDLNGDEITNIFKYVMPKSILVTRTDSKRVFAVMCNYKFDMEHGIAVVFENEKFKDAGPQDIIL